MTNETEAKTTEPEQPKTVELGGGLSGSNLPNLAVYCLSKGLHPHYFPIRFFQFNPEEMQEFYSEPFSFIVCAAGQSSQEALVTTPLESR